MRSLDILDCPSWNWITVSLFFQSNEVFLYASCVLKTSSDILRTAFNTAVMPHFHCFNISNNSKNLIYFILKNSIHCECFFVSLNDFQPSKFRDWAVGTRELNCSKCRAEVGWAVQQGFPRGPQTWRFFLEKRCCPVFADSHVSLTIIVWTV